MDVFLLRLGWLFGVVFLFGFGFAGDCVVGLGISLCFRGLNVVVYVGFVFGVWL